MSDEYSNLSVNSSFCHVIIFEVMLKTHIHFANLLFLWKNSYSLNKLLNHYWHFTQSIIGCFKYCILAGKIYMTSLPIKSYVKKNYIVVIYLSCDVFCMWLYMWRASSTLQNALMYIFFFFILFVSEGTFILSMPNHSTGIISTCLPLPKK